MSPRPGGSTGLPASLIYCTYCISTDLTYEETTTTATRDDIIFYHYLSGFVSLVFHCLAVSVALSLRTLATPALRCRRRRPCCARRRRLNSGTAAVSLLFLTPGSTVPGELHPSPTSRKAAAPPLQWTTPRSVQPPHCSPLRVGRLGRRGRWRWLRRPTLRQPA
jgi:hypothetical protein